MKNFEYEVREYDFNPTDTANKMKLSVYLNREGLSSWELILIQPLQSLTPTGNISLPGQVQMKLTFLCFFKRRKLWIRKFLYRVSETWLKYKTRL
jgi:hypothetical protein